MITDEKTTSEARTTLRSRAARSVTAVAAVAVVGLIAAACGSSTPSASPTTTAASPAGTTASTSASASSQDVVNSASNAKIGSSILVDSSGKTLYTFSADSAGMSACTGPCATNWPPLTVASGITPKGGTGTSGTFATITRSDGTLQVTVTGKPLYTFAGDSAAGDTNGQNLTVDGGTWTVVKVGASAKTTTPPATKTTTTSAPSGGGYGY
jgi:predicted lipoprotein with Yx(FWY)xxD motif